jgi:hypothetical protein
MFKHLFFLLFLISLPICWHLCKYGVPSTTSDYGNFGSFIGGSSVLLVTVYFGLYAMADIIKRNLDNRNAVIARHVALMRTYYTANSGGYTGDGYAFLNWLWPNAVQQLPKPATKLDVNSSPSLREMVQWRISVSGCPKAKVTELVAMMSENEIKLAKLYLNFGELPDFFRSAIEARFNNLDLSSTEQALFR